MQLQLTSPCLGNKQLILFVFLDHMEWYIACSRHVYTDRIVLMKEGIKNTIQRQTILTTEASPSLLPLAIGHKEAVPMTSPRYPGAGLYIWIAEFESLHSGLQKPKRCTFSFLIYCLLDIVWYF